MVEQFTLAVEEDNGSAPYDKVFAMVRPVGGAMAPTMEVEVKVDGEIMARGE